MITDCIIKIIVLGFKFSPICSINRIKKVQKPYPETARFPCDPNGPGARSDIPPISAHKVRPGDIDIVAAIGDSLTAGNGMYFRIFEVTPAATQLN